MFKAVRVTVSLMQIKPSATVTSVTAVLSIASVGIETQRSSSTPVRQWVCLDRKTMPP